MHGAVDPGRGLHSLQSLKRKIRAKKWRGEGKGEMVWWGVFINVHERCDRRDALSTTDLEQAVSHSGLARNNTCKNVTFQRNT